MPSINEVLLRTDKLRKNDFEPGEKAGWLIELDGRLYEELLKEGGAEPPRAYPEDGDAPLLAASPYDRLYEYYLCAMMDFYRGETKNYNNSVRLFNEALGNFRRQFRRAHRPDGSDGFKVW